MPANKKAGKRAEGRDGGGSFTRALNYDSVAPEGPGTGLPAILIPGLCAHPQLSSFDLWSRLSRFIAEDPQDLALPLEEAEALSTEAFRLWAVAASYGLGSDVYR